MSNESSVARLPTVLAAGRRRPGECALLAVCVHALIWTLGPTLFLSSLHQDTLEIIYWSHEPALGYFKHPPLAVWLVDAALRLGGRTPILSLMLLAQVSLAISAGYIFATVRLFASPGAAALGVFFYLASPMATYYVVQVNHNSLLVPFWSAALFYGLRYLERLRAGDAFALGIAAGVAALEKYEILLLLVTLLIVALLVPRYRKAFTRPASYACVGLFVLTLSPNIWWLWTHTDSALTYALESRGFTGPGGLVESINNAFVGNLVLALGPVLVVIALRTQHLRVSMERASVRFGGILALTPSVGIFILSLVTMQVFRQGWTLPFTPSIAVGAALVLRPAPGFETDAITPPLMAPLTRRAMLLSLLQLLLLYVFLTGRAELGHPIAAYDLDARQFAAEVTGFWHARQQLPLECLIIDDELTASAPILYLAGRPHVVDFAEPSWSRPEQIAACGKSGAVAILAHPESLTRTPAACPASRRTAAISEPLSGDRLPWSADLYYVPPAGQTCG